MIATIRTKTKELYLFVLLNGIICILKNKKEYTINYIICDRPLSFLKGFKWSSYNHFGAFIFCRFIYIIISFISKQLLKIIIIALIFNNIYIW